MLLSVVPVFWLSRQRCERCVPVSIANAELEPDCMPVDKSAGGESMSVALQSIWEREHKPGETDGNHVNINKAPRRAARSPYSLSTHPLPAHRTRLTQRVWGDGTLRDVTVDKTGVLSVPYRVWTLLFINTRTLTFPCVVSLSRMIHRHFNISAIAIFP